MQIGIGIGITNLRNRTAFNALMLFQNGEQGVAFEPDPNTCFTDTAGTTPAGVGDAVALMLDGSGNGHDATQPTAAARPILARVPDGGRRNLLTYSEDFSKGKWQFQGSGNPTVSFVGDEQRVTWNDGKGNIIITSAELPTPVAAETWTVSFKVKVVDFGGAFASNFEVELSDGLRSEGVNQVVTLVDDGEYHTYSATHTFVSPSGSGIYLHFRGEAFQSPVLAITEAQLEKASEREAYQRVGSTYDVTEAGKADKWHLVFNGINDFMQTPSIDFTGTDEMSVFAGVRVIDTTSGLAVMLEHGATALNAFNLQLPANTTNQIRFSHAGNSAISNAIESNLPDSFTDVLTAQSDLSNSIVTLRRGGQQVDQSGAATGGGNFQNLPMFIGGQAGNRRFFNGHIYFIGVRGKLSTASEIDKTEAYVAEKTGIEAASEATWDSANDTYTQNLTGLGI